tara:strand:+ start:5058 stop:5390 length:333 start_codon:yes stop_codon:yes gene_type:complete
LRSHSRIPSENVTIINYNVSQLGSNLDQSGFVENQPIVKSYGPLDLDLNNIQFDSGIFFVPTLNYDSKPLFLAIKCDELMFNIRIRDSWKGWFKPFFSYELKIINDFCKS